MAMDDILKALEEQAESDCAEIIDQAKAEADAILRDAREQAEAAKEARLQRTRAQVEPRASQLVNSARLQNKRDIEAARAAAIEEVFDAAGRKLAELRGDPAAYGVLLKALLDEALAGSEGDAEALVDQADVALLAPVVSSVTCTVTAAETPMGGVTVMTCDGKVARRNTLEDRLEAVHRSSTSQVAEILFG
jgi:vacuolar-type H+-ATPase subunit E/Vma4